jgi:hypothetical protein
LQQERDDTRRHGSRLRRAGHYEELLENQHRIRIDVGEIAAARHGSRDVTARRDELRLDETFERRARRREGREAIVHDIVR